MAWVPRCFLTAAGFIKIDTAAISDTTTNYIEVLDGSRVHPETYEWAKKMAVDALEYDEVMKFYSKKCSIAELSITFTFSFIEKGEGLYRECYRYRFITFLQATMESNPSSALEEILEAPDRLKDLDLDAFAEELERQGYGNKRITLYDIRDELFGQYREPPLTVPFSHGRGTLQTADWRDE